MWGSMSGKGTLWHADGRQCVEGLWMDGNLVEGTALDVDGSLWRVVGGMLWDWRKAEEQAQVGRVVSGGVPPRPSPARGEVTAPEWHGVVELAGRALYRGRVRALSPIDSGFDGSKTFGWLPEQVIIVLVYLYKSSAVPVDSKFSIKSSSQQRLFAVEDRCSNPFVSGLLFCTYSLLPCTLRPLCYPMIRLGLWM